MAASATGYGPRARLLFDGDENKYEHWEINFFGYLRIQKLLNVVNSDQLDANKNAEVFAELVQCLDDRSLTLVIRDAKDDGKKALEILRQHYIGQTKPRVISLYTELTNLNKRSDESVTDYILRAETAASFLINARETISDGLLIAMVLKGLPDTYKLFSTIITQKETSVFKEFKTALRNFEEIEKSKSEIQDKNKVMSMEIRSKIKCFNCGKIGHKKF